MKRLLIVANWKSNKTEHEAATWFEGMSKLKDSVSSLAAKHIILCPPYTLLSFCKKQITQNLLPISMGAQDISHYKAGQFTGAVNGSQIKEFGDYVLVGHSERRICFSETDEVIVLKTEMARQFELTPIFCVQNEETPFPQNISIIAYEPPSAIGTGNQDNPQKANEIAAVIKKKNIPTVLYGGSVTADNVSAFTSLPNIDGVLVGGASLDPQAFLSIILHA